MSEALANVYVPSHNEPSTAAQLGVGPFRNPEGIAFVRIQVNGHFEHWPVNSTACERFIEQALLRRSGQMPKKAKVNEIKRQLEGSAWFDVEEHPTPLRLASHAGSIYLDLCDWAWRAI